MELGGENDLCAQERTLIDDGALWTEPQVWLALHAASQQRLHKPTALYNPPGTPCGIAHFSRYEPTKSELSGFTHAGRPSHRVSVAC